MRLLNGLEIADFIKERQAKQVRALRQAHKVFPKLAIVRTVDDPRITAYVNLKKAYGADILVDVADYFVQQAAAAELIAKLNNDATVHGIIVQLPLADPAGTDELLGLVAPAKDVDGLVKNSPFTPATPMAILWLLAGYNVDLKGKAIVVVGQGRLVGAPLTKLLQDSGYNVATADKHIDNLEALILQADVIITGVGQPGLITSAMVRPGAVVVDAGVATDQGKIVGDVDPSLRERSDLSITPVKGGVGPLTVCALFDNLIRAAQPK